MIFKTNQITLYCFRSSEYSANLNESQPPFGLGLIWLTIVKSCQEGMCTENEELLSVRYIWMLRFEGRFLIVSLLTGESLYSCIKSSNDIARMSVLLIAGLCEIGSSISVLEQWHCARRPVQGSCRGVNQSRKRWFPRNLSRKRLETN